MATMASRISLEMAPARKSTEAPVGTDTLIFKGTGAVYRIKLDDRHLPTKLVRLIPTGYAHVTMEKFVPFVTLALAMESELKSVKLMTVVTTR